MSARLFEGFDRVVTALTKTSAAFIELARTTSNFINHLLPHIISEITNTLRQPVVDAADSVSTSVVRLIELTGFLIQGFLIQAITDAIGTSSKLIVVAIVTAIALAVTFSVIAVIVIRRVFTTYRQAVEIYLSWQDYKYQTSQTAESAINRAKAVLLYVQDSIREVSADDTASTEPVDTYFIVIGGEHSVQAAIASCQQTTAFEPLPKRFGFDSLQEGFDAANEHLERNFPDRAATYIFLLLPEGHLKLRGPKDHCAFQISEELSTCYKIIGVGGIGTDYAHCISTSSAVQSADGAFSPIWKDEEQLEKMRHLSFRGSIRNFSLLHCIGMGSMTVLFSALCIRWNAHGLINISNCCVDQTMASVVSALVPLVLGCAGMVGLHFVNVYWMHHTYTIQELLAMHKRGWGSGGLKFKISV